MINANEMVSTTYPVTKEEEKAWEKLKKKIAKAVEQAEKDGIYIDLNIKLIKYD